MLVSHPMTVPLKPDASSLTASPHSLFVVACQWKICNAGRPWLLAGAQSGDAVPVRKRPSPVSRLCLQRIVTPT